MSYKEFAVEVLKALAWPVTVVVLAALFRNPLCDLIRLVRSVKYKDFEFQIEDSLKKVADAIGTQPSPTPQTGTATPAAPPASITQIGKVEATGGLNMDLAAVSARGAILEAWIAVESAGRRALQRYPMRDGNKVDGSTLPFDQFLRKRGELDDDTYDSIQEMKRIRNTVVHAPEGYIPGTDQARSFISFANKLITKLDKIAA